MVGVGTEQSLLPGDQGEEGRGGGGLDSAAHPDIVSKQHLESLKISFHLKSPAGCHTVPGLIRLGERDSRKLAGCPSISIP